LAGVSLHTLVQPSIAASFINDPVLINQGFLSWFLFCAPDSIAGQRPFREPACEDIDTLIAYDRRITQMLLIEPRIKPGTRNVLDPPTIDMATDAQRLWIEFHDDNEKKLAKGALNALTKAIANKLPEQAGRIAAILALARGLRPPEPESDSNRLRLVGGGLRINSDDMAGAITLAQYYLDEMLRFVEVGTPDQNIEDATTLLEWLRKRAAKIEADGGAKFDAFHVTINEIYQKGPRRFRKRAEAARTMGILLKEGYVKWAVKPVFYDGHPRNSSYRLRSEPWS
jgi:hypothetical protein